MPANVVLTVTEGGRQVSTLRVEERAVLLVGKETDCHVRFPQDEAHRTISRHHCLLDISPPLVRIRDLGSRNGTFVNGSRVTDAIEGDRVTLHEIDLKDGDEIQLGASARVLLRLEIRAPVACFSCGAEIGLEKYSFATQRSAAIQCAACQRDHHATLQEGQRVSARMACVRCGKTLIDTGRPAAPGETLCGNCSAHPSEVAQKIIDLAQGGTKELRRLDHFTLQRELGRGGMGAVYLARHEKTGAQVALKILLPHGAVSRTAKQLFLREIENTRLLDHPYIVRLFDFGNAAGAFYFTMEYCAGGSVEALMKERGGTLPLDEAGPIVLQVLAALEHAHTVPIPRVQLEGGGEAPARGLVHRDLKPHNIFLVPKGQSWHAKVGDFGLAKAFDTAGLSGLTCTGAWAGTPYFMPRQQAINFRFAKPEVDVWAAAACLYFMLAFQPPRAFRKDRDVWQTVLETNPVPIATYNPHLPKRVAQVIDRAVTDDPAIPFTTASQLRAALEAVL